MGRMPARARRWAIHAGEGPTATSVKTDTVRRGQRSGSSTAARGHVGHGPATRFGRRRLGQREGKAQPGRQVTGDSRHAPGVGAVALDRDVEHGVHRQAERLGQRRAGRRVDLVAEDEEPRSVVGEAELPARAQHPVGEHAAHLAPADLEPAGQHRADGSQRDPVPHLEVECAAHDVEGLPPGLHDDPPDPIGSLYGVDLGHPG